MAGTHTPRSGSVLLTAGLGTLLVLVDCTSPLTTLAPTALDLHAGAWQPRGRPSVLGSFGQMPPEVLAVSGTHLVV
jgi:hypothetical protein